MLKIRNLKQLSNNKYSMEYCCDGGEWGEFIYYSDKIAVEVIKKPNNDHGHLKHLKEVVDKTLRLGVTEAYTMWY